MTTLHQVELGVLGPLQVRQHGAPVAVPGAKPRAILTMLGLHGGSLVPAEALVELLWGDNPPRTAAKALQTHISALRRTLGDGFVLTQGAGWTLAESDVDASRYKLAARLGRDAAAAGDTGQAVARFEEALGLWRGTPELPDGRRGTSEKTRWIEGHAALVEDRADALLATGRAAELIGELEAAVAEAPLRERRWGQLMLALYRVGRQGEALAAYQRARAQLADELGVDPGPELRRLEAAIVAQDSSLDALVAQQLPSVTRAVTFLLTDIEGSTAAWEADADAMAVALARHDELVEQVVTSRGGRLIKTRGEGDATFSVFERPSAAAAAAIELQDAIGHEPWALRQPMRIRVALHTGEVELRDGDYYGRAVNRAARLRSLAVGGQILCSGATAELVIDSLPDDVMLTDLGMRQLRNLPRPEHVFELRLETGDTAAEPPTSDAPMARPALPAVLVGPGPFVGRGRELDGLLAAWQTALAGGMQAALVAGEPGVGKTRLAGEWSRRAYEQGAVVLYGRCDEDLGAPYQPFAEALRALVPCVGADRLRGLRGVEALLPLVPGLTDVLPDMAAPTRADPDTERYALFDAVVALLGVASAAAPVVLILDDLHWAAKPTLLLLRHLLRFGEHARVQIIGTYRSTDLDRSHPLAAMLADLHRDGTANRVQLSGLDEDDVTAYVAEAGYDDEELGRALASVTGGNPFFLIEALRHVDESGGRWDPSTLPQGVREAVSRRLSRLGAETNKALAAAAVVGSRFALELVERVVDDDLVDAFDEACKAGIVIEEPGGRYRFNHALVRQSLLAELPSVRRMRLHQRIAATLESQQGADDELLAELAHHYFECAWAGNAAKAVEYCRRAADQAMARLAYEGAADLYDRALHALEEIDDELPDRDDQVATLLIARCEALLAAGDVATAADAVPELQRATADSARLAAWATCFDGQLSMLIHPERLDEVEAAVGAAAAKLAQIADAAGEAKAHTVRAGCLARLGRIGDCEMALDDALTAARRAGEHRRVNNVLANAPLAALWGPNPVPRAGGRCLDVVRLLRITTDSPAVEATSTRCQAVLEAFRGRAAAARRMIESARRTVTELGLRHALLEVEQFAGIVELVADDVAAAEPHLRQACNGFRRMGLDADTAETAALLGRTCLVLGRDDEADELCSESERLAGHALKPSIAWRTLRAQLLSRRGDHDAARRLAQEAASLAERTDALVDHGDACLTLATVLGAAGDVVGARAAAERAAGLYDRKGAVALAEIARSIIGARAPSPVQAEAPRVEPTNACVQMGSRLVEAVNREAWDEVVQLLAPHVSVESRRKIVGFTRMDVPARQWPQDMKRYLETGMVRYRMTAIAVRGESLALMRLEMGTADTSSGAPQDDMLQVVGLDDEGRIALQVKFDVEDIDAAFAELDAVQAQFDDSPPAKLDNACVRAVRRVDDAGARGAWGELDQVFAPSVSLESRRKIVGFSRKVVSPGEWASEARHFLEVNVVRCHRVVIAVRGERLALIRTVLGTADESPGAPEDELLHLLGLDEEGRIALQMSFDVEDIDAAIAELDAVHARLEESPPAELDNACVRTIRQLDDAYDRDAWDEIQRLVAAVVSCDSHRKVVGGGLGDIPYSEWVSEARRFREILGPVRYRHVVLAVRGERFALTRLEVGTADVGPGAPRDELLQLYGIDDEGRVCLLVWFDVDDMVTALAELDAVQARFEQSPPAELDSACVRAIRRVEAAFDREAWQEVERLYAPNVFVESRRKVVGFEPVDLPAGEWAREARRYREMFAVRRSNVVVAVRGERVALTRLEIGTADASPGAPTEEVLQLFGLDAEDRIALRMSFDVEDIEAALAELDAVHARFEKPRPRPLLENAASRADQRFNELFAESRWDELGALLTENIRVQDRRRGLRREGADRATELAELKAIAGIGVKNMASRVVATRGQHLALVRTLYSGRDTRPEAFHPELLRIAEVDVEERIVAYVAFDADDFDAAIAELDARYLAGEAAAHARTWSLVSQGYAAINRHELPAMTPDAVSIDHRKGRSFAPGELSAYLHASWDALPQVVGYVEAVHRLNVAGALVTWAMHGMSPDGFDGEWREVSLTMADGDRVSHVELFDEIDIDAAIERFDQLSRPAPRLENAASRVYDRVAGCFTDRDWDGMADAMAENMINDDRRRMVNSGVRRGRDVEIANGQAFVELGGEKLTSTAVVTRGGRLALCRSSIVGCGEESGAFRIEFLSLVEIDDDELLAVHIAFDLDDFDSAIAELDARYLAGEAAAHAHAWSAVLRAFDAFNERQVPATTPDWVNIDHRGARAFSPGELIPYMRAAWELAPRGKIYIESVHRLSDLGAVVTQVLRGTSPDGFDAEWLQVNLITVDGDLIARTELFDEEDLDAALAHFDELHQQTRRLENAASQEHARIRACIAARDWNAVGEILADEIALDDRRRTVNSGVQRGREAVVAYLRGAVDVGLPDISVTVIATRGDRLELGRTCVSGHDQPEAFRMEFFSVIEINADKRIVARVAFDLDDIDAAFNELDARYLAGEAAAHAHTWSVVSGTYAAMNRHELFATTPDWVNTDRRRHAILEAGGLNASLRSLWELVPDIKFRVDAVHRLTDLGAVTTHVAHGVSHDGFHAEWRGVEVHTVDGDLINRCEIFDEEDLDAALAHFDELHQQTRRLENAASRAADRFLAHFAAGDWDAMRELLADNLSNEDRRPVVGAGVRHGPEAQIADMRTTAEVWSTDIRATVMATRGERLVLKRYRFRNRDQGAEAFQTEILGLLEIDADGRAVALVSFDTNDIDAAFEELEARYLAGEAADFAHVWSVVSRGYATWNRHEFFPTTPNWVNVDHRRPAIVEKDGLNVSLRSLWNLVPDLTFRVEAVHKLTDIGAVCTHAARGVSQDGFDAEWRGIEVMTVDGDLINRCEIFDEADLDAALARFAELKQQALRPKNAATLVDQRFWASFAARDWDAMSELLADDVFSDDRRRVVNAGVLNGRDVHIESMRAFAALEVHMTSSIVATRGERLAITHLNRDLPDGDFGSEVLYVIEIDADNRIARGVFFDPDDIDDAFEELDARYLAGEAATHSQTWSVVSKAQAGFVQHELPATTSNALYVDHRSLVASDAVDLATALKGSWDVLTPGINVYIETVHRLSGHGAVVTQALTGTSRMGFDAEWRMINIFTVEGDLISRCEVFEDVDLHAALARFDELT